MSDFLTHVETLEEKLNSYTKRASDTEEDKCNNAIRMIKDAIKSFPELKNFDIEFIQQGSYYNKTNVKQKSDVDLCVRLTNTFYFTLPTGKTRDDYNIGTSNYTYEEFKESVHKSLISKFGYYNVTVGDKSIKIKSNTYRIDADVVPCFEYRVYNSDGSIVVGNRYFSGQQKEIINFPEQHYNNGVSKNKATHGRYKFLVRILKKLKSEMKDKNLKSANNISSFVLECALYNIPNNVFFDESSKPTDYPYTSTLIKLIGYLKENINKSSSWKEVNGILDLFNDDRTSSDLNNFLNDLIDYALKDITDYIL